ncbi:hypothetical protein Scep_029684 [Stephania cephalantha]|uniref:Uncharacterized protein n=1 Tax=Stephania cephalantha TaxID=152367 RepID=A0AAP0E5Y3_9MAGN
MIAPKVISVDTTPILTENCRKRKRGRRLKRLFDGASSSGLEIPLTTAVACIHVSPLAPVMMSRFYSMSSVVMVPPTIILGFASRSSSTMQPLHQFQQDEGRRYRYALGNEQTLISRSTEKTGHTGHMTCGRCGQEGHIISCDLNQEVDFSCHLKQVLYDHLYRFSRR